MKLEEIYKILKKSELENFYTLYTNNGVKFIYKNDINVSISKIGEEKRFGYDYFFDNDNNEKTLNDTYDKLIKKLCEYKDFPETYNNIYIDTWGVKYGDSEIYYINTTTISNLSSLHISLPVSINTFDFIYNFCKIYNDYMGANTSIFAEKDIESSLNIQDSLFEGFLTYR